MSEFNIEVQGGSSVRLPTAGKYCDRDIIVTASGGGGEIITVTSPSVNGAEALEIFKLFMNEGENLCIFKNTKTQFVNNECVVYICQKTSTINSSYSVAFGRYRTTGVNFQANPTTAYDCIFSVGDTFEKVVLF
jgi:hypothetical protein